MIKIIKVSGDSMSPEFRDGDFVVTLKIPISLYTHEKGDVVVVKHHEYGVLLKRVDHTLERGKLLCLSGTGSNSIDSRRFGPIPRDDVVGKVIFHVSKPKR